MAGFTNFPTDIVRTIRCHNLLNGRASLEGKPSARDKRHELGKKIDDSTGNRLPFRGDLRALFRGARRLMTRFASVLSDAEQAVEHSLRVALAQEADGVAELTSGSRTPGVAVKRIHAMPRERRAKIAPRDGETLQ
jgi:hypothetical protein